MFFSWLDWGLGKEVRCYFQHIISEVHIKNMNLSLLALNLITRLRYCFSCPPPPPPLFILYSLEGSHHVQTTLEERSYALPPWRWSSCINYLEFCFAGGLSLLSHLFIYLFTHLLTSWTHGYLLYTSGYNLLLPYLCCFPNCSSFGHWKLFQLTPVSTWYTPIDVGLFKSTFLLSVIIRYARIILFISCPRLRIS